MGWSYLPLGITCPLISEEPEVVEDDEVVRDHEGGRGSPEAGLRGREIFEFADGLVADRAHGAADEGGYAGRKRGLQALHERSERHEGAFGRGGFALFPSAGAQKDFPSFTVKTPLGLRPMKE